MRQPLVNHRARGAHVLVFAAAQLLLVALGARAEDSVPLSVKVTGLTGDARYYDSTHRDWNPVRVGDELVGESVLQTAFKDSGADIELTGPGTGGRGTVHLLSNSVLKLIRASSKKTGSVESRDIVLDLRAGQIRVRLDGVSDYSFTLSSAGGPIRVAVPRNTPNPTETIFIFNSDLTVLKGVVKTTTGTAAEKVIHAGEQLRSGANGVTKTPETPEPKTGP